MIQLTVTFLLALFLFAAFAVVLWFRERSRNPEKSCNKGCTNPTCQCLKGGGAHDSQSSGS